MDSKNMNIVFSSKLVDIVERNGSFDLAKLWVAYTGDNQNKSRISKDAFERAIDTIYNCPVVCNYDREADEIGSHDFEIVRTEDGMKFVNITQPCGIVPESASYSWETLTEDDGSVHEYLVVDVLLWKRQEVYDKIKSDGVTKESMEITVLDGYTDGDVYVITNFEFTAFCLLGTAEPCFESAALIAFSKDAFKDQLHQMVAEMKADFAKSREPVGNGDIDNSKERGEKPLNEKHDLMAEFGLTEDQLDFSLEDFSLEELREKFEAMTAEPDAEPAVEEPAAESDGEPETFALAEQFREELMNALCAETVESFYGETCRYCYVDYDADLTEVYAWDSMDWNLYGFSYSTNGDNVVIDFESKKRKKFAIVDFNEGDNSFSFASVMENVKTAFEKVDSDWAGKYATLETERNTLAEFKSNIEAAAAAAQREAEVNEVFGRFEELEGIEEFETLRKEFGDMALKDIEEKCFAIKGKYQKFSVSKPNGAPKLIVKPTIDSDEPYGGIVKNTVGV